MTPRALIVLALLASTFSVAAQDEQNRNADAEQEHAGEEVEKIPRIIFGQLDADEDGGISKDEAQDNEPLVREFDRLDRDDDGRLSVEELKEWDEIENVDVEVDGTR